MTKALRWINVFFFLGMVIINMLANTIPLGGKNTGEISSGYPTLFTPAPYTFSIWGLIYILTAVYVLFQTGIIRSNTEVPEMGARIGIFFTISCILNILWILTWHYGYIGCSVITIILLLIDLIIINSRIKSIDAGSITGLLSSYGFQIYMGWLAAATIANISVFLVKINWSRFGMSETVWTIIILIIGALIGAAFVMKSGYLFSTMAVIWAYVGILIKHVGINGYDGEYRSIIATLVICLAIMVIAIILGALMQMRND